MEQGKSTKENCSGEDPGQEASWLSWEIYFLKLQIRLRYNQAHQIKNDLLHSGKSRYVH